MFFVEKYEKLSLSYSCYSFLSKTQLIHVCHYQVFLWRGWYGHAFGVSTINICCIFFCIWVTPWKNSQLNTVFQIRRDNRDNMSYMYFSTETYVVTYHHSNRLPGMVLMNGHNICLCWEIKRFVCYPSSTHSYLRHCIIARSYIHLWIMFWIVYTLPKKFSQSLKILKEQLKLKVLLSFHRPPEKVRFWG